MDLTMSSIVSTCILVSAMILVVCPILRKSAVIRRVGPRCVILILMCMVVRMFFPVELWFTYSIRIEHILPFIRRILNYEIMQGDFIVRIWDVLMCTWVAGIVFQFGRKLCSLRILRRFMTLLTSQRLCDFLAGQNLEEPADYADSNVRVYVTEFVRTPCLVGIKNGYIFLPEKDYSEKDLFYIIQHEMMHYKRKDVLRKAMIDILCTVFWWNPIFCYLKKTVFHMIEISNDRILTQNMTEKAKVDYMECLMSVAAQIEKQEIPFGVSFSKDSFKELKQRLYLIGEEIDYRNKISKGLAVFAAVLLCMSFAVILEPYTEAPEGILMTSENTYLIQNGEMYDVYVEGEFFFSTDDLAPFPGVTIYEDKEEAKDE